MPVFDGLFKLPRHNSLVQDLLFELLTWHGLAKLRLHTDSTLAALDSSTTRLGILLREFAKTTEEDFNTRELPSEEASRGRRKASSNKGIIVNKPQSKDKEEKTKKNKNKKTFSLLTYKLHSLGDYVTYIKMFGTSDSFNTQTVSFP